jgi:hypothetical protein
MTERQHRLPSRGRRQVCGEHLGHPGPDGSIGDFDQRQLSELGQHLHPHGGLKPCSSGGAEVVSGFDPVLRPLLVADLAAAGITPCAASELGLNLCFATFGITGTFESLSMLHAGPVAVAHAMPGHRADATRKVLHPDLPVLDVGHDQRLTP